MIPQNDGLISNFEEVIEPSKTYKLNLDRNRIVNKVDEIEALKQAVFLMLSIERYDHLIYSWNYGVELKDLMGQPMAYVQSEVKRRITEALIQDDRIESVDSFEFELNKNKLLVKFRLQTIFGDVEAEKVVSY